MKTTATGKNVLVRQFKVAFSINGKVVMSVGLVLVLAFMWGRLLFWGGLDVNEAKGNTISVIRPAVSVQSVSNLERVELPVIAGRNDVITHDMFSRAGWASSKNQKPSVESRSIAGIDAKSQEMRIRQIASSLDFGTIIDGVKGEGDDAFVDGELVSVGSKLRVWCSDSVYDFTVEDVTRDKVVLKSNEFTISIKMSESNDVSDN